MSDRAKPPLRLLLSLVDDNFESSDKLVTRFEAGTARGNGGSREDGGSTPALGTIKENFNHSQLGARTKVNSPPPKKK